MKTIHPLRATKHLRSSVLVTTLAFAAVGGLLCLPRRARAQLPNAWQIDDNSGSASLSFSLTNPVPVQEAATNLNGGWTYTVNARFVTDHGGNQTMAMIYGDGTNRWEILWSLSGTSNLVSELYGGGNKTYVVTTNGTGRNLYHTHQIIYNPTNHTASYLVDGQVLATNWTGSSLAYPAGKVFWGGASSSGVGAMNFHKISFAVTNEVVAVYNGGTEPDNAPDPAASGWTLSVSPPPANTSTNAINPDAVPLPTVPVATTLTATNIDPHQATPSGVVNEGNLAATVWFEWGTDTNYGNITAPQSLLSDTNEYNVSQTITGLAKGTTYHFRCVATNLLGITYGGDGVIATPLSFVVSMLADGGLGSLRQAIADDQPGDTIIIATNGVITLAKGELVITNDLTIAGPGPVNLAISGNNVTRVFNISSGVTVGISGLTIRNGHAANGANSSTHGVAGGNGRFGGGIYNAGTLSLSNCVVTANAAGHGGNGNSPATGGGSAGGIGGDGGGIFNSGELMMMACDVSDNICGFGGNGGKGADAAATLGGADGGTGGNGGSGGRGGGICNAGMLTLDTSTVEGNNTAATSAGAGGNGGEGGVAYGIGTGGPGGFGGSGGGGGGIYNAGTFVSLNSTVSGNRSGKGGIGGPGGPADPDRGAGSGWGTPRPGGNGGDGGGICHNGAEITLTDCTFSGNVTGDGGAGGDGSTGLSYAPGSTGGVGGNGGAIYNNNNSAFALTACTVSGNKAGNGGTGGIGTSILGQRGGNGGAGGSGGGIFRTPNASGAVVASLQNNLIALNKAGSGGSGGAGLQGYGTTGAAGSGDDLSGSFVSEGYNLVGYNDSSFDLILVSGGAGTDLIPSSGSKINPLLGPLFDNGGPTPTIALLTGSPALDAGDDLVASSLVADQRGYARLSGAHVDIGAFEVQVARMSNPPLISNTFMQSDGSLMFSFTNNPGIGFRVLVSTNIATPLNQWTSLGTATEVLPGQYQFTDPDATNYLQRFYQVVSP